jgi:hypothetical protein
MVVDADTPVTPRISGSFLVAFKKSAVIPYLEADESRSSE